MNTSPATALKALSFALALLLPPAMALGDGFLDNDLDYRFEEGSETEVFVSGLRNSSATHITIPLTVVYEYTDGERDEDGNDIVKHRTCRVTSIGRNAFSGCSGLRNVTISDSVTSIGGGAFRGCSGLTNVTIPDSVTSIGEWAFGDCAGLTSVTIPDSVTSIGYLAFCECSSLTRVTILGNVINDWADDYDSPFYNCMNLATLVLGEKMTKIGNSMFAGCSGLTSVTVPNSVTSIGDFAFVNCSGLKSVDIGNGVTSIGEFAFDSCSALTNLNIGASVASIGESAFRGSGLTSVTIPNSVAIIGNSAFYNCPALESVDIGNSVTSIGTYAFRGSALTSITIPNSVTSIGNYAFNNCPNLENVNIGNGVSSIGTFVFSSCSSLGSFSVASDNPAFKSVDGLLLTKDGKTLLYGVNGNVVIPDGVTDLTTYAFRGCSGLTSVVIPDSVVRLPTEAFDGCNKLWTSWYRTLANLAAGGGASGGSSGGGSSGGSDKTVSLTVTNIVIHYVTRSIQSDAVVPDTNSTGIVNIVAEVVAGKSIAIPSAWAEQYPAFGTIYGTDFSAALTMQNGKRDGAGKPLFVWQDYVAGTDPTDPSSVFTASIAFDAGTGEPVISWSPELSPEEAAKRRYTIYGKARMTDPDWTAVDGYLSDYNFYRVTVEMK